MDAHNAIRVFAQRLKKLRNNRGWSQRKLAKMVGCSHGLISFYENAKKEPGFTVILKLSKIFNVKPAYLMGGEETQLETPKRLRDSL